MAFYDWNHNTSSFKAFVAVVIFFLMVCGVVNLCTPKCIVDGCNSEREEGSSYCYYHKNSAVYKNYLKHSSRTSTYNSSSSTKDTGTSTTSSTVSNKSSYSSNNARLGVFIFHIFRIKISLKPIRFW